MPKYVIERDLPGAGRLTPADMRGIAAKSCSVLRDLGPKIQWLHSYVTADRIYCLYEAPDEQLLREHARRGGFPATRIAAVTAGLDPSHGA